MTQRNNVVTIAKAIGIICVVLAHSMNPNWLTLKVIYTFHMPLFFMLSGFCFKEKYLYDAKLFLKRKILGIYIPFVVYSLIFLALHNVFTKCHIYESNWVYGWKDFAWNISRIITRMSHNEGMLGVFWFLKELFFGNLIFYGVLKLCKGEKWLSVMVLFVITIIMTITEWRIPYISITKVTFYSALFIALGNMGRVYVDKFNKWWIYVIVIFLIVGYVSIGKNIAIGLQNIYTLIPYTLTAIGGSILTMNVSKWISANRGGAECLVAIRRKPHAGNHGITFYNV